MEWKQMASFRLRSLYLSRPTDCIGGSVGLRIDRDVTPIFMMLQESNLSRPTSSRSLTEKFIFDVVQLTIFSTNEFAWGRMVVTDLDRTRKELAAA
jgi:hypothetical protein